MQSGDDLRDLRIAEISADDNLQRFAVGWLQSDFHTCVLLSYVAGYSIPDGSCGVSKNTVSGCADAISGRNNAMKKPADAEASAGAAICSILDERKLLSYDLS